MARYFDAPARVGSRRSILRAALTTVVLAPALVTLLPAVAGAAPTLTVSMTVTSNPDEGPAGPGTVLSGGCVTVQVEYTVGGEDLTAARIEMALPAQDWRSGMPAAGRVVGGLPFGNTPVVNWAPTYTSPDSTIVLPIGNPDLAAGTAGSIFVNLCSNARVNPNGAQLDVAASLVGDNASAAAAPIALTNSATVGSNPLNVTKTAATIVPVLGPPGVGTTPGYELSWDVQMGMGCTATGCGPLVGDLVDTMPLNSYMVSVNRIGPTTTTPTVPAPHPATGIDISGFPAAGTQFVAGSQDVTVPVFIWHASCTAASGAPAQGSSELPEPGATGCAIEYPSSTNRRGFRVTVWVPTPVAPTITTNTYTINRDAAWDAGVTPITRSASHTVTAAPELTLVKTFTNGSGTCTAGALPFQPGVSGDSRCTLYPQGPANSYTIQYNTTAPVVNAVVIDRLPAELALSGAPVPPAGWTVSYTTDNSCSIATSPTDPMWTTVLPPLANVVCVQFSNPLTDVLINWLPMPVSLRAGFIPAPGAVLLVTNTAFGDGDNLTPATADQTASRTVSVLNRNDHTLAIAAGPASVVSGGQSTMTITSQQSPFIGNIGAHDWTIETVLPADVDFIPGGMSGNDFTIVAAPRSLANPAVALPSACTYTPATRLVRCVATGDSVDATASSGVGSVNFQIRFRVQVRLGTFADQFFTATSYNDLGAVPNYPTFGPVSGSGASLVYLSTPTAVQSGAGVLAVNGAPSLNLGKTISGGGSTLLAGGTVTYVLTLDHLTDSTSDLADTYVYDLFGRSPATGAAIGGVTPEFVSLSVGSQPIGVAYTCTPAPSIVTAVWVASPCGVVTGVRLRPGYDNAVGDPIDGLYPIDAPLLTVSIVLRAPTSSPHLATMNNQVGLTATQSAGVLLSTQPSLVVHQPFDLSIVKDDGGSTGAAIGSTIDYSLVVSNAANTDPVPAGSITVTDELPADLLPVSASGAGWSCAIVGHTVTCDNPSSLAAGASLAPIAIDAVVQLTPNASVSNTATVAPLDPNPSNNSSTVVTPVVQVPIAVDDTFGVGGGATLTSGNIIANDVATALAALDPTSITIAPMAVGEGSVVNNGDGTLDYTAPAAAGTYSTTYTICDLQPVPMCDTATITFVVATPAPRPPVAFDDTATVTAGSTTIVVVPANDSDPDGNLDVSTVTVIGGLGPSHGSVTIAANGAITYSADADFAGSDQFTYSICDTTGLCDTAVVTLTVSAAPPPEPPVAVDDVRTTPRNTAIVVVVATNDSDPDGDLDATSVTLVTMPVHGTVVVAANGSVTYTPVAGYTGSDTFTYEICDMTGLCDTAVVTLTVSGSSTVRLPTTGSDTLDVLVVAVLAALVGMVLVAGTRRRSGRTA